MEKSSLTDRLIMCEHLHLDYQKYHGVPEEECINDLHRIMDEFFSIRMEKTWQQVVNEAFTQPILFVLKHWKAVQNQLLRKQKRQALR